ncbi:MAG: sigma 54-interacting transcriptional regulator [Halieaceae bacterium]|nr:sigma 54-interacting transcriptional regulator [Halieaceae bacterium]
MTEIEDHGWLFLDSPSLLLLMDEQLNCHHMAQVWRARLQPELAERAAIPASEIFDFENEPGLEDKFRTLAREGAPITNQPVGLFLNEGLLAARFGAWRARRAEGDPPCIVGAATDVSKFKGAQARISELQTQYQSILSAAGEGIHGLDSEGRITFANAAAEKILGWKTEDVLGQRSHTLHHHSYADGSAYPRDDCPIYAALSDGLAHRVDHEVFWHVDGHAVPVEYNSTPILREGKSEGAVVVFRDISDRKKLEEQRREAFIEIQRLKNQLEQERDYLRDEIKVATNFGEIIGESPALRRALNQIESVAPTPVSVLILGDSGVGKEMIARAIHTQSDRAEQAMIKVNCASIPRDLFESEFFGHLKGAFTGAHQDRVGRLQLADGGTLFLDEVGEIPLAQQGKLLRALQEGEFERVGDDKTTKVDVRIVAATNRNLTDEIRAGRFREDLYYRISVFPVEVPPLRERLDDIAPLATHFLNSICAELGRTPLTMTKLQVALLKQHTWPGNIRELKNVLERAVISSPGSRLQLDDTFSVQTSNPGGSVKLDSSLEAGEYLTDAEFRELEKANILAALNHSGGKTWGKEGAAELLGLKPSTLAYRMKVLGIGKANASAS